MTLSCGTVVAYESNTFVPSCGEQVPCRRHDYCDVVEHGVELGRSRQPSRPRARPKVQAELLAWLRETPVTTIHALRRHRFTLRMIAAAEREGLVAVDFALGTVVVR